MKWALIVGERRTGKTSLARRAIEALRARGVRVAGVIQEAVEQGGERMAYDAVRLTNASERATVARRGPPASGESPICSFSFDDAAFARVAEWLAADAPAADVIVIDEVSKAESRGRGHAPAIEAALRTPAVVVLCVRADELVHVMAHFGLGEPVASLDTAQPDGLEAFVAALVCVDGD